MEPRDVTGSEVLVVGLLAAIYDSQRPSDLTDPDRVDNGRCSGPH